MVCYITLWNTNTNTLQGSINYMTDNKEYKPTSTTIWRMQGYHFSANTLSAVPYALF